MPSTDLRINLTGAGTAPVYSDSLPQLLRTPGGLAIVELQGTINFPAPTADPGEAGNGREQSSAVEIGKLVFPHFSPSLPHQTGDQWMKGVYFYIGKHQRMTGEVKKLSKPLAVLRRSTEPAQGKPEDVASNSEALEIIDIVRYKILFASRPEPVGN